MALLLPFAIDFCWLLLHAEIYEDDVYDVALKSHRQLTVPIVNKLRWRVVRDDASRKKMPMLSLRRYGCTQSKH